MQIHAVIATQSDAPGTPLLHFAEDADAVALEPGGVRFALGTALQDETFGRAAVVVIEMDDDQLLRALDQAALPVIEGTATST